MSNGQKQFLEIYLNHRFHDQRVWYESRNNEFSTANEQVITWKAILIGLTALVSFMAALPIIEGLENLWAILAVALPALSTALAAYDGLYAFDRQAKLYRDAAIELQRIRGTAPDRRTDLTEAEYSRKLTEFVNEAESIMQLEQGQWGQLMSALERAEAPEVDTN